MERYMEEKKAAKGAIRTPKKYLEFSNPFVIRDTTIYTTPAQLVYETAFDDCAVSMRNLSAVLPTLVKNASEMMAINGAVDHLINNALTNLRNEGARIKKIAEDNGIEIGRLNYTHTKQVEAKLTCNKAGQYLQIISELDGLLCLVHSAWFAGFIDDDAKASLERQWRRKMIGVAAEIKNITNRAFRAAGKLAETDGASPSEVDNTSLLNEEEPVVKQKTAKATKAAKALPAEDEALTVTESVS
jgi:hypothetical protein